MNKEDTPSKWYWELVIQGGKEARMLLRTLPSKENAVRVSTAALREIARLPRLPKRNEKYFVMRFRLVSELEAIAWFEPAIV